MRDLIFSIKSIVDVPGVCILALIVAIVFFVPDPGFTTESDNEDSEVVSEKTLEQAAEKAAGKAIEQAAEIAAEKAVEEAETKAMRPDEFVGATKVHFLVYVIDIDEIDDAAQNFTANIFVKLSWQDKRLAVPGGSNRQIPLEQVWNPRLILANRQGLISKSLADIVQVSPDGTVTYLQRYNGKLSQPLNLSQFPMDKHVFTIHFVAAGYQANELEFLPDTSKGGMVGGSITKQLSLPDWNVIKHEAVSLDYKPIPEVHAAGFAFRFEAKRYIAYYIWQVVLPLTVVVGLSLAAFWINRKQVGVRVGVASSSILTLIAHRMVLANLLPRLPYMTRMDYFTVCSTIIVFIAMIAVVWTSFVAEERNLNLAVKINNYARIGLPSAFLLLLAWFFSHP
jgi:hypothetical protein